MTRSPNHAPPARSHALSVPDMIPLRLTGALMLGAALALLPLTGFAQTAAPETPTAETPAAEAPAATAPAPEAPAATPPATSPATATGTTPPVASPITQTVPAPDAKPALAQAAAVIRDPDGNEHGSVTVSDTPSGALHVILHLSGIPDGPHAIHIHETGKCDPPDFASAGGHLTGGKEHGALHAGGMHSGDLPNIDSADGGAVNQEFFLPGVTMAEVMDDDGAAFVMHAGVDDYVSQPAGNAGNRIACGVFQ